MKSYRFIISGRVQGVYYRKFTSSNALEKEFKGYVKNLGNGSVEACVTCHEEEVDEFVSILEEGSPESFVENIEKFDCEEIFLERFEIRY